MPRYRRPGAAVCPVTGKLPRRARYLGVALSGSV